MIEFHTDARLGLGQFGIQTRVVTPEEAAQSGGSEAPVPPPVEREDAGHTMIYSTAARIAEPLREPAIVRSQRALLLHEGRRLLVGPNGATIGRSRQADIVIDDPNVSRQHAEVRPRGGAWVLTDLGSTNGSRLNGRQITNSEVIQAGDEIEIGTSVITFELE